MAVAFRSAGALGVDSTGVPAVPYPAGLAAGDLLVIQYHVAASTLLPNTPSGWTKLFGPITPSGGGNTNRMYVYWKIASGSESGTLTFTKTGPNNYAAGRMTAYSGVDGTTPIDVSATANLPTSGTSLTTPSVTTTVANTLLLRMYWDWSGSTTITPPGTDTERYDSFEANTNLVVQLATQPIAAIGATGTTTATAGSATSGGLGATVAVAPPGAPAGPTFIPQIIIS